MDTQKIFNPDDRLVVNQDYEEIPSLLPQLTCEEATEYYQHYQEGKISHGKLFVLGLHLALDDEKHSEICPYHIPGLLEEVKKNFEDTPAPSA